MHKLIKLKNFNDSRGGLTKIFTNNTLIENNFGSAAESYIITFNCINVVRGEHFHKNTNEIFSVIKGKCRFEVIENNNIPDIRQIFKLTHKIDGEYKNYNGHCFKCLPPLRADYTHHDNYCLDC